MQNNCPCCGRKYQVTKQTEDRKLIQDRARAQFAIESLQRALDGSYPTTGLHPNAFNSIRTELVRMQVALSNPELLWSIYRRAEKGSTGYKLASPAIPSVIPIRSSVPSQRLAVRA